MRTYFPPLEIDDFLNIAPNAENVYYITHFPNSFLNTKTPDVCVDKVQSPATRKVCVDEIQSPATRKICVDKLRRTELDGTEDGLQLDYKSWTIISTI